MLTFEAADVEVDPFELEEVVKLADEWLSELLILLHTQRRLSALKHNLIFFFLVPQFQTKKFPNWKGCVTKSTIPTATHQPVRQPLPPQMDQLLHHQLLQRLTPAVTRRSCVDPSLNTVHASMVKNANLHMDKLN